MLGASVGGYRIESQLGQGGMGVVYLARHQLLGRPAAVKVLLPEFSRNTEIVNRFFNEARAATTVRHPGIVEIYDFGFLADGCAYIVMEFLDGQGLAQRIAARGRMPAIETLSIARQIAGALSAAHGKGIVHRDLKPDNVFLVRDPEVPSGERIKLLDFGIAKLAGDGVHSQKTRTGAVMGTPTYMAPEQCRGVAVDHRADVYALGCIVFEMLCARPPFVGEGSGDVLAAHIYVEPPMPRGFAPDVPPAVEALVLRLLIKDPAHRVQTADAVIAAIDEATSGAARAMGPVTQPASYAQGSSMPTSPRMPSSPAQAQAHPTTLGAAAGSTIAPSGGKRRLVIPLVAGALVLGGLVAFLTTRGGDDDAPAKTAAIEPEVEREEPPPTKPAPVPAPAPATAPAPAPAPVTIAIESDPPGADVVIGGEVKGQTPYQVTQAPVAGDLQITVRRDGFKDRVVVVAGDKDASEKVALVKKKAAGGKKKPGGGGTDNRNGSVNPF